MEKLIINGENISEGPEYWASEREKYLKTYQKAYYGELKAQGILETVVRSTGKSAYEELVYRMKNGFRKFEAMEFVNEIVYKHSGGDGRNVVSRLLGIGRNYENGIATNYSDIRDICELLEAAREREAEEEEESWYDEEYEDDEVYEEEAETDDEECSDERFWNEAEQSSLKFI